MKIDPLRVGERGVDPMRDSAAVSSQRQPHNQEDARLTHAPLPPLEVGQELGALVVEAMADGRVVLDIGGVLVEADNPGGLYAGQTLPLRVELLQPQIMLHIVEQEFTTEDQLANLLRHRLALGDESFLASLQTLTESLETASDGAGRFEEARELSHKSSPVRKSLVGRTVAPVRARRRIAL